MNKSRIYSPVAIDLGAANSGVSLLHTSTPWEYSKADHIGVTYNVDVDNITYSLENRRIKRHQIRSSKRRKLSKRLLYLILKSKYDVSFEDKKIFEILGRYLNRRGYTYLSLADAEKHDFLEILLKEYWNTFKVNEFLPEAGESYNDLNEKLENASDQTELLEQLIKNLNANFDSKVLNKKIKPDSKFDEQDSDKLAALGPAVLLQYLNILHSELQSGGHFHRKTYLKNIKEDLQNDNELAKYTKNLIDIQDLFSLIGHISNLQLRVLRKYFNNEDYKKHGDKWDESRFLRIFTRYIRSWHVEKNSIEAENKKAVLNSLSSSKSVITTFLELSPEQTIPPFEDMNNRRPPRCQSLLLQPDYLDKEHPNWKSFVSKILKEYPEEYSYDEISISEAEQICEYYNKIKIRINIEAIWLRRILDTSSKVTPLNMRLYTRGKTGENSEHIVLSSAQENEFNECDIRLNSILGEQKDDFVQLCEAYYSETRNAQSGLWDKDTWSILQGCYLKPKQKKNARAQLISDIVQIENSEEVFKEFEELWNSKESFGKFRSLSGFGKKLEEVRKAAGGIFKQQLRLVSAGDKLSDIAKEKVQNANEIRVLAELIPKAAKIIEDKFNLDPKKVNRFKNWFSFSQISNIMSGDNQGFHASCPACAKENHWRMTDHESGNAARAVRLHNDTGRPFDGQIKNILERLAKEITSEKVNQIERNLIEPNADLIEIPLLIEQNSFQFQFDMLSLKKKINSSPSKSLNKAKDRAEKSNHIFKAKKDRIKKASNGICPYNGSTIGELGEIDHIIPRSLSRKSFGAIFNTEMNLIYSSRKGNQAKGNKLINIEDLNNSYLMSQFSTANSKEIEATIAKTLEKKLNSNEVIVFEFLSQEQQRDLRHALFFPELRAKLSMLLVRGNTTRVNGTQRYFLKVLKRNLTQELNRKFPKLRTRFYMEYYHPHQMLEDSYRVKLAEDYPAFAKKENQGFASHIVDAAMIQARHIDEKLSKSEAFIEKGLRQSNESLKSLIPNHLSLKRINRRDKLMKKNLKAVPLFKETFYAVRYLPFIIGKKSMGFGFSPKNCIELEIEAAKKAYSLLKNVLEYKGSPVNLSFDELQSKASKTKRGYVYLPVKRSSANAAIFNFSKGLSSDLSKDRSEEDTLQGIDLLESIRYETEKVSTESNILGKNNQLKTAKDFENEAKKFSSFSFKLPSFLSGKVIEASVELTMIKSAWLNSLDDEILAKVEKVGQGDLENYYARKFPNTNQKKSGLHKRTRKKFSLPRKIAGSPGTFVHARRLTNRGDHVFQLHAVDGAAFSGFPEIDGKVKFSKAIPLQSLQESNNIQLYERFNNKGVTIQPMYEGRLLELPDQYKKDYPWLLAVWLKPATKGRRQITVRMEIEKFSRDFQFLQDESSPDTESFLMGLQGTVKLNVKKVTEKQPDLFFNVINSIPRDSIKIEEFSLSDNYVQFNYSEGTKGKVKTNSLDLQELYNQSQISQ